MSIERLSDLLGLAQKARKLVSGELAIEQAVKSSKVKLLLIAADASETTKKSYRDMAAFYKIVCRETLSKEQFGNATGKPPRAAVAIIDKGFSIAIDNILKNRVI